MVAWKLQQVEIRNLYVFLVLTTSLLVLECSHRKLIFDKGSKVYLLPRNVEEPLSQSDVPLFWHIPKSGGSSIKMTMIRCFNLNVTIGYSLFEDPSLIPFVDSIMSVELFKTLTLFNSNQHPRIFTMIRHPFHRIHSLFHYQKYATHEKYYYFWSILSKGQHTFLDFLKHNKANQNFMVSSLTNIPNHRLEDYHVEQATQILANNFLIGLTEKFNTSVHRFQKYFEWNNNDTYTEKCIEHFAFLNPVNKNPHKNYTKLSEGNKEWEILLETQKYDLKLYENAKEIFQHQSIMFHSLTEII